MGGSKRVAAKSVRDRVSAAEWAVRVDLAACYRLMAHYGWDDGIFTHNSARVPGEDGCFLLNPWGHMFDEITASNLVKVNFDGDIVDGGSQGEDADIIHAGFVIHSAVLIARHDVNSVMHTHSIAGMAVAAQKRGLLPLTQKSMRFHNRLAYHDYEGIADDLDERDRLVRDLGDRDAMILRNHGLLTAGPRIADAFQSIRYLQHSCEAQVAALAGGLELVMPPPQVCEHAARQYDDMASNQRSNDSSWAALRRMLDRIDPSYAD